MRAGARGRVAKRLDAVYELATAGLGNLRAYRLRSSLTLLAVAIGIVTVSTLSAAVAGLNSVMASQIRGLGSALVFVRPTAPGEKLSPEELRKRRSLSVAEVKALSACPSVRAVSAIEFVPTEHVAYNQQQAEGVQVLGVTQDYDDVHDIDIAAGRFLSAHDVDQGALLAVLGAEVAETLFPLADPLGKRISINGRPFTVVGVAGKKGKFLTINQDAVVLIPVGTASTGAGAAVVAADLKAISPERAEALADEVRYNLHRQHRLRFLENDDFAVFGQETFASLYRQVTTGIYAAMMAVASIGLIVGGLGVMNIMLVSVAERTREVGLRRAIGATSRDILYQFLSEATILTLTGGVAGIVLSAILAWLINALSPLPAAIQPGWTLLALLLSVGVGLIFGLWPALRASRMDPVEALRHE